MKQRIYIDTSIVGGFFDKEFAEPTKALFERLKRKEIVFVLSNVLTKELLKAPQEVRDLLLLYKECEFENVELNQESESLANAYIDENVVGATEGITA
jgi:predicted nucleic acid-binding protein